MSIVMSWMHLKNPDCGGHRLLYRRYIIVYTEHRSGGGMSQNLLLLTYMGGFRDKTKSDYQEIIYIKYTKSQQD